MLHLVYCYMQSAGLNVHLLKRSAPCSRSYFPFQMKSSFSLYFASLLSNKHFNQMKKIRHLVRYFGLIILVLRQNSMLATFSSLHHTAVAVCQGKFLLELLQFWYILAQNVLEIIHAFRLHHREMPNGEDVTQYN